MFNLKKFSACVAAIGMSFTMYASTTCAGMFSVKPFNNSSVMLSAYAFENQSSCDEMVVLINSARIDAGLNPLKIYPFACDCAAARAKECAELFSHTRPDGSPWYTVILEAEVPYLGLGENLAFNEESADNTVKCAFEQLMDSPKHKANIMNDAFTHIGVGVYRDGNYYYFTQTFITWDGVYECEYIPQVTTQTTNQSLNQIAIQDEIQPVVQTIIQAEIQSVHQTTTQTETQAVIQTTTQTETQAVIQTTTQAETQPSPQTAAQKYMKGDVDGNGVIDVKDAGCVLDYYVSLQTGSKSHLSDEFLYAADVNNDNAIDVVDAAGILNYYCLISTGKTSHF